MLGIADSAAGALDSKGHLRRRSAAAAWKESWGALPAFHLHRHPLQRYQITPPGSYTTTGLHAFGPPRLPHSQRVQLGRS